MGEKDNINLIHRNKPTNGSYHLRKKMHPAGIKQNTAAVIDNQILHGLYGTLSVFCFAAQPDKFVILIFVKNLSLYVCVGCHYFSSYLIFKDCILHARIVYP